ncbi:hypothetical protein IB277_19445 [Ensifer sp. ENS07]|uniref:hypothetical protein n=1 Tax=Ensifer sp. ENS07 TaxID=2769274 RepID=UPI001784189D|nr:hypothetical protein [Ensifer sp. ENS07]MBD9638480.1 hypothetical protein [Ensifer sp. ENS07]
MSKTIDRSDLFGKHSGSLGSSTIEDGAQYCGEVAVEGDAVVIRRRLGLFFDRCFFTVQALTLAAWR